MLSRRSFLGACLVSATAPAIVRASSLMPVVPHKAGLKYPGWTYLGVKRIKGNRMHRYGDYWKTQDGRTIIIACLNS